MNMVVIVELLIYWFVQWLNCWSVELVRPGQKSCILMRAVPKPNQIGWVLVPKQNQSGQFYVPICFLVYFYSRVMNHHWVTLSISRSIRQTYRQSIRLPISLNVYKCLPIGQVKSERNISKLFLLCQYPVLGQQHLNYAKLSHRVQRDYWRGMSLFKVQSYSQNLLFFFKYCSILSSLYFSYWPPLAEVGKSLQEKRVKLCTRWRRWPVTVR